jgi:hypothetical protein
MLLGSIWGVSAAGAATIEVQSSTPAPPAPGRTQFVGLKVNSKGVALKLSCSSADGQGCSGTIFVTSNETLQGKKVLAVGSSNRTKVPVRIAQASFSLAAGGTSTVQFKLNSTGVALLRRFHAISAVVLANEEIPNNGLFVFLLHEVRFTESKSKHKKHH